ncbi:MAG: dihydroorotate dehydrogenase electron transfer subunit [Methanosarcinaceae archaeon]|nr:dihydroorotate dehydrogenase electron transfer subunit [Methanosarcinaceae archaeon]
MACDCSKKEKGKKDIPKNAKIIKTENASISGKKTIYFDISFENPMPGNFCMVWIRGIDEIPLGCSYENGVTFQVVGDATAALDKLKTGDTVGIRGPYGRPFTLPDSNENILIVAGGIGAAPLGPLADFAFENETHVTTVLGARTENDLIFEDRFDRCGKLYITTDDGTKGEKGFVTDVLKRLNLAEYDRIYVCGPEIMMKNVFAICDAKGAIDKTEFSIERYFKCGVGVCGACCIDESGLRVCKDGPVFPGNMLKSTEFGKYGRDASGKKITF